MTLSALNASLSGAAPHVELPRDLGGKSAGGARFAAIVNALAAEDLQTTGGSASTAAAASPQGQVSPSAGAQRTLESLSINGGVAGLEGLVYGALAQRVAATPSQSVSSQAGEENAAEQDASGSASTVTYASPTGDGALRRASGGRGAGASVDETADDSAAAAPAPTAEKGADANLTLTALLYGGLASSAAAASGQYVPPSAGGASWRAIVGAGSLASADQASGGRAASAPAAAVQEEAGADFTRAGALDLPLTIRTAANGDASLGVSAVQSRTYLGVDSAARSGAGNSIWRSQARAAVTAAAPARSVTAETLAATSAAASMSSETPAAQPSTSRVAATSAAPVRSETPETFAATSAAASTPNETPAEKRSTSDHNGSSSASLADLSASSAPAAAVANASPGVVNAAVNPVMTGVAPIACDQLAARLATEANALTSQTASSNSTPAVVPASADAVKELQIDLAPASLGAVSVKMRLAQGQLSVVMEVAKPSTLKAIESERGAIADRLGTNAQSVEILMAKPDAANQTSAESDHARDQQPGSRENGQSDPNQPSQGDERQPSGRENAANRWSRPAAAQPTPSGRGFGDLVV